MTTIQFTDFGNYIKDYNTLHNTLQTISNDPDFMDNNERRNTYIQDMQRSIFNFSHNNNIETLNGLLAKIAIEGEGTFNEKQFKQSNGGKKKYTKKRRPTKKRKPTKQRRPTKRKKYTKRRRARKSSRTR